MLQSTCATGHTADVWIEVRDSDGSLWCEYNPHRQVIRNYRKIDGTEYYGEIAIDDLITGKYAATRVRRNRNR